MNSARVLGWCLAVVVASPCFGQAGEAAKARPDEPARFSVGPAVNWTFPVFTDREGFRQLLLRGTEARAINANHIEVTGFHAVVFSGDASERVDTVLLSPQATFHPRENRASGASTVRLILSGRGETIRDDVELTGRGWTYDHGAKKVSIAHDVRVTFHAQLNDILQ